MCWTLKKAYYRTYQAIYRVAVKVLDWSEPELLTGAGSIKKLPEFIKDKGLKNMLIVTDKGLMSLHLLDGLFESLDAVGVKYALYDGVQPNPTFDNINDAYNMYVKNNCDGVIAFGGGSSMDCAKVAAARVVKPNMPIPKMRGQLKIRKKLPLIFAVPTTAGTGSETTLAAVVTNPQTHEKYAINDPVLRP
ncbi:MAG: iron-containing alcohol dehydrogenase, partial [Clostridiales bacterium]|nr:iron-containing alcohol dehydrogenase [Clostridiales bacterium]